MVLVEPGPLSSNMPVLLINDIGKRLYLLRDTVCGCRKLQPLRSGSSSSFPPGEPHRPNWIILFRTTNPLLLSLVPAKVEGR